MRARHFPIFLAAWLQVSPAFAVGEDPYVEGEVIVTFRSGVERSSARNQLARRALKTDARFSRMQLPGERHVEVVREPARRTADLIAELEKDPAVEIVEPNYLRKVFAVRPDDPDFGKLWGLENTGQTVNRTEGTAGADIRFLQAWKLARRTSAEVVVGVIDTGVDISHPDLVPNLWTNPGEIPDNGIDDDGNGYTDDVHGFDFADGTGFVTDSDMHGTHVAGIIAAAGRNGLGGTGVQYKAKILPLKVSSNGEYINTAAVIAACNYAVALKNRGVNIVAVNGSYGGRSFSTTERNAILALRNAGIVFCAAAGNDGTDNDSAAAYPANYDVDNILSVAALSQNDTLASYSNHGAASVDIAAPGSNIHSTIPSGYGRITSIVAGSTAYDTQELKYSGTTSVAGLTRPVHACGTGETAAMFPAAVHGNIALIQRGSNTFGEKAALAKAAGAVAAVIYDNTGNPLEGEGWTLGSSDSWLPVFQITQASGNAILASLPATATVVNAVDPEVLAGFSSGTSMASPHVAGAIAFAAWNFPSETYAQRISRVLDRATVVPALSGFVKGARRLDLLRMIDTDEDGLPDWWETEQFGNLAASAAGDPDGDGFSNYAEFLSGTSPISSASRLSFEAAVAEGNDFRLGFPTVEERSYRVEWSATLEPPWHPFGGIIEGDGLPVWLVDPEAVAGAPRRFYRLSILDE